MKKLIYNILIIEDNPADAKLIQAMLKQLYSFKFQFNVAHTLSGGLTIIQEKAIDIILLDLNLPHSYGLETFLFLNSKAPHIPIIILSGQDDERLAIETVKKGAQDYLVKNRVDGSMLSQSIRYSIERKKTEIELKKRIDFERLLANISTKFINLSHNNIDDGILETLEEIGSFIKIDNSCLFQITNDSSSVVKTHEWDKKSGQRTIIDKQKSKIMLYDSYNFLTEKLSNDIVYYEENLDNDEERKTIITNLFNKKNIKSIIIIPMISKNKMIGFLSFFTYEVEKILTNDRIILLKFIANIFLTSMEHKWATKARLDSEEKYKKMINTITDYIYTVKIKDGRAVETKHKDASVAVTGYTPDDFEKNPYLWIQMVHKDDNEIVNELTQKILNGNKIDPFEHRIIRKDGKLRWVRNTPVLHYDDQGNLISYNGLLQDITESKLARQIVYESEERWRSLVENAPNYIIIVDKNGVIQFINKDLPGLKSDNAVEKSIFDFWQPDYHTLLKKTITKVFQGKKVCSIQTQHKNRRGKLYWLDTHFGFIKHDKKVVAATLISQNITEKKEIELALKEEHEMLSLKVKERTVELINVNKELLKSSKLKDEFLASMSHELRTPLNSILGISEVLQEELYGKINTEQKKALKIIENSGNHLLELINDILDLSKIEAGELQLSMGPVHIDSLLLSSISIIKQLAAQKNQQIIQEIDSGIETLFADERRLKQILVNLLSNAVKFTPNNGKIGITVKGDKSNNTIEFKVWDTGIGIEEEKLNLIFKPFTQLDSSLSRKHAGTGLGLSLVSRLVEMHGGEIIVKSKINEGSCFKLLLPWNNNLVKKYISEDSLIAHTQHKIEKSNPPQHLILLVEDYENNIKTISDFLTSKNFELKIARNGIQAIEMAKEYNPDIILMDIQMPKMDGLAAIKTLRNYESHKYTPIIAVTALAMPGDKEKCINAGANDYISKPLSLKSLLNKIEAYLF